MMEKDRMISGYEQLINFKKTFFGFKAQDVLDTIDLLNTNLTKAREVYEEKLAEMKKANELLSYERNSGEEKLRQLKESTLKLQNERDEFKRKIDSQQDMETELQNALHTIEQMREQIESCQRIEDENKQLKKKMIENEAVCQAREQQQSKLLQEIEELKQQNKDILAKFLEERKQMDSRIAEKNLKLTQLLEMHRFTLKQSRSALEKLSAQFDESCELADQIQVDD